jgi:hypothetical protein
MRHKIDQMLYATFTRGWEKRLIDNYLGALKKRETQTPPYISEILHRIDVKGTALVTYVAMMIAGLGICAPLVAKHPYEEAIVIVQISCFLLIAIGCLRCISVFNRPSLSANPRESLRMLERELVIRQEIYTLCHRAAIFLTVTAFISMPFMLLWSPEL